MGGGNNKLSFPFFVIIREFIASFLLQIKLKILSKDSTYYLLNLQINNKKYNNKKSRKISFKKLAIFQLKNNVRIIKLTIFMLPILKKLG